MKNFIKILIAIGIISLILNSCQTKKIIYDSESKFYTDSIYSKKISEYRKHNIYLPKGFVKSKKYPIIYATDGNNKITEMKETLDSLINNNIIKPIIFVASFSNNKIADSTSMKTASGEKIYLPYRYFEYVNQASMITKDSLIRKRFQNHMSYFVDELIPQFEQKFSQYLNKKDRYFYGVSNGAGFGIDLLYMYPNLIGSYICLSAYGDDIQTNNWNKNINYPNLYLQYGSEESHLKEYADFLESKYKELNLFIEIKVFDGGHNNKYWSNEFIEVISRILKKK